MSNVVKKKTSACSVMAINGTTADHQRRVRHQTSATTTRQTPMMLTVAPVQEKNNVTSLMGNVLVGVPIGGQTGGGIRPYVSGGFGLLKQNVPGSSDFLSVSRNDWGMNVGVGAQVFASDHVGFRGDIRYLRSLQNDEGTPNDFALGNFDFWRWTVGVTFR